MQIQKYKNVEGDPEDRNPNNHTIDDTYDKVNQTYFFEQVKATTAFAGHLAEPISFAFRIHLPLVWVFKY